jgi:RNA polymerase sigma-B factor
MNASGYRAVHGQVEEVSVRNEPAEHRARVQHRNVQALDGETGRRGQRNDARNRARAARDLEMRIGPLDGGPDDRDTVDALFVAYAETRESAIRDRLIQEYDWLAVRYARRFEGRGEPLDELIQVARIGLFKAVDRFSPERGTSFPGFAIPTVLGELKRHFRDTTWSVGVNRRAKDLYLAAANAREALNSELGRPPTVRELAGRLGVPEDDVLGALEVAMARFVGSVDASAPGSSNALEVRDRNPSATDRVELQQSLGSLVSRLPPRDQEIIKLRFVDDLTQSQIAAKLGVSQVQVSRLLSAALRRLRDFVDWQ